MGAALSLEVMKFEKHSARLGTVLMAHICIFPAVSSASILETSAFHKSKSLPLSMHETTADNIKWLRSGTLTCSLSIAHFELLVFQDIIQHTQIIISNSRGEIDPHVLLSTSSESKFIFMGQPALSADKANTLSIMFNSEEAEILPQHLTYPLKNSTQVIPPFWGTNSVSVIEAAI